MTQNGAPVIFNGAPVTQNGAPVIFNGAPVTQNGAPVIFNGAPVTQNGAPVTQNEAPVILNGAPKYSELRPVVVNGTTVIFDRVPDSLEGAPVTVNEAPNALDGRQWYKIPHLWFFKNVAGLHRALFVEKILGEHLERLGEHGSPKEIIKFHPCGEHTLLTVRPSPGPVTTRMTTPVTVSTWTVTVSLIQTV